MQFYLFLESTGPVREFTGTDGQVVKAVDVVLTDRLSKFAVTAYDKQAQLLIDHPIKPNTLMSVDLSFNVKVVNSEKGDFKSNLIRLNNFGIMYGA